MHALTIENDGSLRWSDVPDPERHGDFDVLLDVKAAGENRGKLVLEV